MEYKIYLAGKFIETENKLDVYNSYDNSLIGHTFLANKDHVEEAIIKAQEAFKITSEMPSHQKESILTQIYTNLKADREKMATIIAKEAAKPIKFALAEVDRSIQTFKIAAEECKRINNEYFSIDWTKAGENKEGFVKYVPIGPVSGISPFNFPLNLTAHKIAPAIATGNPIILKPSSSTPLSVLLLAEIIDKTELPKGAFSVLPCNRETGNILVTDNRFKKLTFTGSPEVGWEMKAKCGRKKITLELGGNAAAIVAPSCKLEETIKKTVSGAFAYSGQVCIHLQRIYVHESIFSEFTTKFITEAKKLKQGSPLDSNTDISAMIDIKNAERVESWINEAKNSGAEILLGGNRDNTYVEPTIITNTTSDMKVNNLEVFGPVVCIEKYSDFDIAIYQVNQSEYGLQAGIFSDSLDEINRAFNNIEVGGLIVNDVPTFRVDHMPYGGVKSSGLGREGIKYTMKEMLEPKLMVRNYK
ncbi:MAG: aldehyde dehydrogenase family protein [Bacteroidales bacterium]|jgi:glyceraldehyde-3-phosphate dehydrogenase (NADP+)|nr:aldehyde dehydrogenase family protein [Bacteroidales bacterium]